METLCSMCEEVEVTMICSADGAALCLACQQKLSANSKSSASSSVLTHNVQDCSSEMKYLHGTCVWAARCKVEAYTATDTLVVSGDGEYKYQQKNFPISPEIRIVAAGSFFLVTKCVGFFRGIYESFESKNSLGKEKEDESIKHQTKKSKKRKKTKVLHVKKMVSMFKKDPSMRMFMKNYNAIKSRSVEEDIGPQDATLILINRNEKSKDPVSKVTVSLENEDIHDTYGWAMGNGSGFSAAETILAKLTPDSKEDEILEVVRRAFSAASRADPATGGSVLIYKGSKDKPWSVLDHEQLKD